jgi:hypothetical protein
MSFKANDITLKTKAKKPTLKEFIRSRLKALMTDVVKGHLVSL